MLCNECLTEPATIDHLDLSLGEVRLRSLCRACAADELQRWNQERLGRPAPSSQSSQKDRRAA
jgi:protein-arginine kinase activator protein McsA